MESGARAGRYAFPASTGHFCQLAVGLMAFGNLFVSHAVAIVVALIVSAAIGICVAGFMSQVFTRRREGDTL
jgi:holin-like protein